MRRIVLAMGRPVGQGRAVSYVVALRCDRYRRVRNILEIVALVGFLAPMSANAAVGVTEVGVTGSTSTSVVTGSDPGSIAAAGSTAANRPLWQQIDDIVVGHHRGPVAPRTGDSAFVRRIYLDLIGRSPTADEARDFCLAAEQWPDGEPMAVMLARREALIDTLLARPEFTEHYATVLDVWFMERRETKYVPGEDWRGFLTRWLADSRPFDELCREILAADGTGDTLRPAAKFYLERGVDHHLVTRDVGRVFFGRNVQCAQCHDHPLVGDYHQAEYYGILAFLNRSFLFVDPQNQAFLGEKADGRPEYVSVFKPEAGSSVAQTVLPAAMGMDVEPHFVEDADAYLVPPETGVRSVPRFSLRQQLAVLATHSKSQAFSRNMANRIWAHLLGVGVVHPVDLHHSDNPPVSAELLHLLADQFVALRYDLRGLIKQITLSETYQRTVTLPSYETWDGPPFDAPSIHEELTQIDERLRRTAEDLQELSRQMVQAEETLSAARTDVAAAQKEIDAAQQAYRTLQETRTQQQKQVDDLEARRKTQQELATTLREAAQRSEKAAQLLPNDQELAASHTLIVQKATVAEEALKGLDAEQVKAKEELTATVARIDGQRGRAAGLGSRRVALGEFVTEARGAQRVLQVRQQRLLDLQGDAQRQQRLAQQRLEFVQLRQQVDAVSKSDPSERNAEQTVALRQKLVDAADSLTQEWVREYAARPMRGLSPEQIGSAIFTALEAAPRTRIAAEKAWEEANKENPQMLADATAREANLVSSARSVRGNFESEFIDRFSWPGGSPQDSFFAAADQALFMLNDATVQEWLQPAEGSLIHRLDRIVDTDEATCAMYWSVFSRGPDAEELAVVRKYLEGRGESRVPALQELVWGMLASAEFRFMP